MEGAPVQQPTQSGPQQNLIKPDQVLRLPQLNEVQKTQFSEKVRQLWQKLTSLQGQESSNEFRNAHAQLAGVSQNLVKGAKQFQAARSQQIAQQQQAQAANVQANANAQAQAQQQHQHQQQQAAMAQAQQQVQQAASMPQAQDQQPQPMQQQQPPRVSNQFLPQVMARVQAYKFIMPPTIQDSEKEKWLREAKMRFGQALQRVEVAKQRMTEMNNKVQQRRQAGHTFAPEEQNEYQERKKTFEQHMKEGNEFLQRFKQQQDQFKAQTTGQAGVGGVQKIPPNPPSDAAATGTDQSPAARVPPQIQIPATQGPAAHTISSAVIAARQANISQGGMTSPPIKQEPGVPQSATSTVASGLPQSTPIQTSNTVPASSQFSNPLAPNPQPESAVNTTPQQANPTQQIPTQPPNPNQPQPLTQDAARQRANSSYIGQPNTPQTANPHGHPSILNREREVPSQSTKFPIPKQLNVPPPTPVNMAPARPTYSGGPNNAASMMGQPAIQQTPGYVLESEGQHVLSKKKLRELVMQVTGGSDSLTPDAEEVRAIQIHSPFYQPQAN
jgi:transcription initiation factor TFIID subunit 12